MEELKFFADLVEPDERQRFFALANSISGERRPLQMSDVYERAAAASLHVEVPEAVRSHFATAQNLVAYSWFYYPFNVVAELHAYISVEFALRTRFPELPKANFKDLLLKAVAENLLKSERFTYGRNPVHVSYPPNTKLPSPTPDEEVKNYVDAVVEAMRTLRNSLAHGSTSLHMKGGTVLLVCSEIINQLFPEPP